MAWSAKLQSGTGGVQGYNEWQLIFDASTQTVYKATYQLELGNEAPDVLYHTPDNGAPIPIRATGKNRVIFLEMNVTGQTNWDGVLNAIAPISRLVNGPDSQAIRASTNGTADNVRVAIKPDGATYTTYFDVLHGFVDTSTAFTSPAAVLNTVAYKVVVALTCKPYGYGDSFTLRNDLASSPHFIEDSNADGLADGWASFGTAPTTAITTSALICGKAQQITVDDTNYSGIACTTVTCTTSNPLNAHVWIRNFTGDDLRVLLTDGSNITVASKTIKPNDSTAVSDKQVYGSDGVLWYRVSVSSTGSPARANANARIIIARHNSEATEISVYVIDGAYLNVGSSTAPPSFASSTSLKNRYDPTSTSSATQQQINYLDVWGVPGDAPAILKTKIEYTSTNADSYTLTKRVFDSSSVAGIPYFFDSSSFNIAATSFSTVADAARMGGSYLSCTVPTATNRTNSVTFPESGKPDWMNTPLRGFLFIRTTDANASAAVRVNNGGSTILIENIKPAAINTWSLVDIGVFNTVGLGGDPSTVPTWSYNAQLRATGTAGEVHLDGVYFLPTFEVLQSPLGDLDSSAVTIHNGAIPETFTQGADSEYRKQNAIGSMDYIIPMTENRIIVVSRGDFGTSSYEVHDLNTAFTVELTITPRTSHLLGTS